MPQTSDGNSALQTQVIDNPHEVGNQLQQLGKLTQEDFQQAISAANLSRADETAHSTKGYAGSTFYSNLIKQLRDILVVKGFKPHTHQNIELVLNDTVAIAVCKGDENTGKTTQDPHSARKKGGVTLALFGLSQNELPQNEELFEESDSLKINRGKLQLEIDGKERDVWILMHYSQKIADGEYRVKAELSRPSTYDNKGRINSFSDRIMLDLMGLNIESQPNSETQFTDDIDFNIE
ncbi:hypothetical protein [Marinobacter sp. LV10MA510-1]|uniref:hypothetical protein n=1 Tax=Marinobacter sp. LV10MA510-1 TaxID=1415567 RepID=UPI000BF3F24F|nr:hypothetical protein [Marinobacter sp. LV10MA510-1]PFG08951.1 hypothetical protein ATI45_1292 [Marinobacter sp. LV10MA510-1]